MPTQVYVTLAPFLSAEETGDLPHEEPFQTPALSVGKPRLETFDDIAEALALGERGEILGDLIAPAVDPSEWNVLRD
ncbi:MAG TPA: hypothetical protein VGO66_03910 [Solirubrobacterales bacterium]|nr:hypothetical protein [Solirubrobacterales bacterium]